MEYFLSNLRWLVNAFALDPKLLANFLPTGSCVPNELADQYEMIVDKELVNIKCLLTPEQLEEFKFLNSYIYSLLENEELENCWYDNNFIYSKEWEQIRLRARDFEKYMGWDTNKDINSLYSDVVYINQD